MRRLLALLVFPGLLTLTAGCGRDRGRVDSTTAPPNPDYAVAPPSKEIIAQNVLAAQLAPHDEVEAKATFATDEAICASIFVSGSSYVEKRRITAFLVSNEMVIEEQSVAVEAGEKREEFDFRFSCTPRPAGSYEIKLVEIARSNAKPVLLARLFLSVE